MALLDRFKKKREKEESAKVSQKRPVSEDKEKPQLEEESLASPKGSGGKKAERVIAKQVPQAYRLIREPQITEKATSLSGQNKYVFKVSPRANKTEIRKTIEALYGVKVVRVHLIHAAAKRRQLGRSQGWRGGLKKGFKKAIVTLAQGEKIELLPR